MRSTAIIGKRFQKKQGHIFAEEGKWTYLFSNDQKLLRKGDYYEEKKLKAAPPGVDTFITAVRHLLRGCNL